MAFKQISIAFKKDESGKSSGRNMSKYSLCSFVSSAYLMPIKKRGGERVDAASEGLGGGGERKR